MTETSQRDAGTAGPRTISRRRVMAGAAWSVPVIAVATAAPAAAQASLNFDVGVTAVCQLVSVGGTRGFRVRVNTGILPSGSTFLFTAQERRLIGGAIPLGLTAGVIGFSDTSLASVQLLTTSGQARITTSAPIGVGGGFDVQLNDSLLNAALLTQFRLSFEDTANRDNVPGNDAAGFNNTISVGVGGLGTCVDLGL